MMNKQSTLNCRGALLSLEQPVVMGILNVTPDSFYDGGRYEQEDHWLRQSERMLSEGASIVDVGGMSSRPGAKTLSAQEEADRVLPVIASILKAFPKTILSVDTWRAEVAQQALEAGASIINDISGGNLDPVIWAIAARYHSPYILMHMNGTPENMQHQPHYEDVVQEILDFFIEKIEKLRASGIVDVVLDPGFGFGKSIAHNYQLLNGLHIFGILDLPVLAGISRKSMIWRPLEIEPLDALPATAALHLKALQQGARILRVHDVKEAVQVIQLWQLLEEHSPAN